MKNLLNKILLVSIIVLAILSVLTSSKNLIFDFPLFILFPLSISWFMGKIIYNSLYSAVINSIFMLMVLVWQNMEFLNFPKESVLPLIHKYGVISSLITITLGLVIGLSLSRWKRTRFS